MTNEDQARKATINNTDASPAMEDQQNDQAQGKRAELVIEAEEAQPSGSDSGDEQSSSAATVNLDADADSESSAAVDSAAVDSAAVDSATVAAEAPAAEAPAAEAPDSEAPDSEAPDSEAPDSEAVAEPAQSAAEEAPVSAVAESESKEPAAAAAAESSTPAAKDAEKVQSDVDTSSTSTADAASAEAKSTEAPSPEAAAKSPRSSSGNATLIEEGPTTPTAVAEAKQDLTLDELIKVSPALAPVVEAHQNKTPIVGKVIGWNKGGFHVSLDGIPAFCPKSQMEIGNPKRASAYVDREFAFSVAEIRDNGKRIVINRKGLLRDQRKSALEALEVKAKSGEPVLGRVTSVTDFGVFVDVDAGIEGLVHLSQMSRQRIEKPSDIAQVGQDVQVKVLKIEKGGDRISLSMKALEPDPWKTVEETFPIGEKFTGTVVRASDFGLFVDVGRGIEGLLHSSQTEIGKGLDNYPPGTEVSGWIREVDAGRRRLSLSLREVAKGNPWSDLRSRYEEGQQVEGQIEQVAKFGVFILLEPGLSGLLPFSATSHAEGMRPQRLYTPGDTINVQIDAIDPKRKRISLAPVGSKLEGTKSDLRDYQKKAEPDTGLNAMAAAFAKLQEKR